ncbi:MAG: hypothetical protein KBA54_05120 [Candidatus Cloacimonetes bacterium]|nr:hypothetical protein [Candidatus Cloacimonadota bacterium]
MPDKTGRHLLSDADALRRIKLAQIRAQLPALAVVAVAIALKAIWRHSGQWLQGFSLALVLAGIILWIITSLLFRCRQRIAPPAADALLSPIAGSISSLRKSGNSTELIISKPPFAPVELRSPHSACRWEDGALCLDTPAGRISFRFAFRHLQSFASASLGAGNLIGMALGQGRCEVTLPGQPELCVQTGDRIDAADPLLPKINFMTNPPRIPAPDNTAEQTDQGDI